MLEPINCLVLPRQMLENFSKAGIDFDAIADKRNDHEKAKNILSPSDFIKYDRARIYHEVDSIDNISWPISDHYDPTDDDSDYSTEILSEGYEKRALTAPVFFGKSHGGLILCYLTQYTELEVEKYHLAWFRFYKRLIEEKLPIQTIASGTTFKHYINMSADA